ncbi:MAG: phosphatase PAP2 family protein [Bacillus sp. (in: firmicutes)]
MDKQRQSVAGPKTYGVIFLLMSAFVSFLIIMYSINSGVEFTWEKPVQQYFQHWNYGFVHTFFMYETELGSRLVIGIAALALMVWLLWKHKDLIGVGVVGILVASTDRLNVFVKHLVARDRPSIDPSIDAVGYSFPSGHAMLTIVTYGLIAYFVACHMKSAGRKALVWLGAFLIVLTTGVSRVVLSAHFPSDVLAGYCLGGVCLILGIKLYRIMKDYVQHRKNKPPVEE